MVEKYRDQIIFYGMDVDRQVERSGIFRIKLCLQFFYSCEGGAYCYGKSSS